MATKKECDRCGRQWDLREDKDYDYGESSRKELSTLNMDIPQRPGATYQRSGSYADVVNPLSLDMELCQDCARAIYAFAKEKPGEKVQ